MISVTREQLEQARRVCENYAAPGARLWRVVLRTPPAFDEDPNEITKHPELEFQRMIQIRNGAYRARWTLRGSVRIVLDFDEWMMIRVRNMDRRNRWHFHSNHRREPWPHKPRPHVVIYRETP